VTLLLALLVLAGPVDTAEARKHYEAGRALYSVDRFADAAAEFDVGFNLAPRPLFLFNSAQALRRLGETTRARAPLLRAKAKYEEYLRIAGAADPEREQAQGHLASLEAALAQLPPEAPPPDAPIVEPAPKPPLVEAPAVPLAPVSPVVEEKGFFARRPWVIALIAGAVAGGVVATVFGVRAANPCTAATVGCIDAR
jgi:tetratricopeptide (TPR) repeat protein